MTNDLVDHSKAVEKVSTVKLKKTAFNHFRKFLQYSNFPSAITTVQQLPDEEHLLSECLGKFSSYLFTKVETLTRLKAHENYLIPIAKVMRLSYTNCKSILYQLVISLFFRFLWVLNLNGCISSAVIL